MLCRSAELLRIHSCDQAKDVYSGKDNFFVTIDKRFVADVVVVIVVVRVCLVCLMEIGVGGMKCNWLATAQGVLHE